MESSRQAYVSRYLLEGVLAQPIQKDSITDTTCDQLRIIQETRTFKDPKVVAELKKRKLLTLQRVISFKVEKGPHFAAEMVKEETDLSADMLQRLAVSNLSQVKLTETVGLGRTSS